MHGTHLVQHIHNHGVRSSNTLFVIGVVSNPVRYQSRYRLAREWLRAMEATPNVKVILVETAFGDRHHEIADPNNPDHLCLRTKSEIWIKENMINLGVRHTIVRYPDAKYFCWCDMDVFFRDPHWAQEAIHQLQHFDVLQPWTDCLDLGANGNVFQHFKSFGYQHQRRVPKQKHPSQPYQYAHTGYVWCCTRRFWEAVQGLPDFCILGSADHHAAFACIGEVKDTIHRKMGEGFFQKLVEWEQRAVRATKNEVGFIMGRIEHMFHGPKKRRYYRERWQILIDHGFNPYTDLMYDEQGMIQLINKPKLEMAIRQYNRSRFEDSIEES